MQIDKSKIRDVIGTGGKVIREIVAETGAKVDIDDEGVIKISSSDRQPDRGGAQVDPGHRRGARGRQGLRRQGRQHRRFRRVRELHGRQGRPRPRLRDHATSGSRSVDRRRSAEGQEVKVKVLEIDPRGKVRLSMRVVDQETGAELEDTRPPREGGDGATAGRAATAATAARGVTAAAATVTAARAATAAAVAAVTATAAPAAKAAAIAAERRASRRSRPPPRAQQRRRPRARVRAGVPDAGRRLTASVMPDLIRHPASGLK